MHREPNMTLPYKGQTSRYEIILATLADLPSPKICAKIQPHGILDTGGFLMFFTIYGHDGHLGQPAETVSEIFHSPDLRRLHIKF